MKAAEGSPFSVASAFETPRIVMRQAGGGADDGHARQARADVGRAIEPARWPAPLPLSDRHRRPASSIRRCCVALGGDGDFLESGPPVSVDAALRVSWASCGAAPDAYPRPATASGVRLGRTGRLNMAFPSFL